MHPITRILICTSILFACRGGTASRYYDGTEGMGRDSIRLELRPDGQYTIVSWEGYSSVGTYVETAETITLTQPQGAQASGQRMKDGSLKVNGHRLVPVDANKPMPER